MTEEVKERLAFLLTRDYRRLRQEDPAVFGEKDMGLPFMMRAARMFEIAADREQPVLYGKDRFGFNRCKRYLPTDNGNMHLFGNVTIDYETLLAVGLNGIRTQIIERLPQADKDAADFYESALYCFDACIRLVERYRQAAKAQNLHPLVEALERVPAEGARNYYEALVSLKFITYILRLNHTEHVTLGRFDQYMYPYYQRSLITGSTEEELLELTELFFIALNIDTDIYTGIQQGDNGQSMMLGGCNRTGEDAFNDLSELCLQASEELKLIDPKINLRVNKNTPISRYIRGTQLTRQGLGFPQYSNDDVVIPSLTALGYDLEDARDYTVAACWEFIIPAYGADIPNLEVMDFAKVVRRAVMEHLPTSDTFDIFLTAVENEIKAECITIIRYANERGREKYQGWGKPLISAFLRPCIERGRDVSHLGAKYHNFGVHGAGLAAAADALAAIEQTIFIRQSLTPKLLLDALESDFVGFEDLQKELLSCPKMGNNDDRADRLGAFLLDVFSANLNGKSNNCGGVFRAGTGTAMEYILCAKRVGATADGRNAGYPYGANFSPSITTRLKGLLSTIQSFTKHDLKNCCNGGPLTIEVDDTVFRNEESVEKVAMMVKLFIDRGGHQMQINSISRARLLDAQKHPEQHANLIVRVWGWSGYFVELDKPYQEHVIRRTEFSL